MKLRSLATALLGTALSTAMSVTPSGAAGNAYSIMKTALANANGELSVRVVTSTTLGARHLMQVTDAGRTDGIQKITLTTAGVAHKVTVELIGGVLYVKGDATILATYMGFSKATSNQLANKWFLILHGNSDFSTVAAGLTISSGIAEVTMLKTVTEAARAKRSVVLSGKSIPTGGSPSLVETMSITTSNKVLPVKVVQSYKGMTGAILFSHWGEVFTLTAPHATLRLT